MCQYLLILWRLTASVLIRNVELKNLKLRKNVCNSRTWWADSACMSAVAKRVTSSDCCEMVCRRSPASWESRSRRENCSWSVLDKSWRAFDKESTVKREEKKCDVKALNIPQKKHIPWRNTSLEEEIYQSRYRPSACASVTYSASDQSAVPGRQSGPSLGRAAVFPAGLSCPRWWRVRWQGKVPPTTDPGDLLNRWTWCSAFSRVTGQK